MYRWYTNPGLLLERARQLGSSEAELLRAYPTPRAQDIVNAWAYIDAHREEIERQIIAAPAERIHLALAALRVIAGELVRINRPSRRQQ